MDPNVSNVSGPDWLAAQGESPRAQRPRAPEAFGPPTGFGAWGPAALALGLAEILFSAVTHVVAWMYASLARGTMSDLDTRLGLTICLIYTIMILVLAIAGVVAGAIGLKESRRLQFAGGISFLGILVTIIGLVAWVLASANLLIVALNQLR